MKRKAVKFVIIIIELAAVLLAVMFIMMNHREPGWHTIGNKEIYYADSSGRKATGYEIIDGKPYYFNWFGIPADKGWIEIDGKLYYCTDNGELATGWRYIDGKAYYFYQKSDDKGEGSRGAAASDFTTAGGLYIPEAGYIDGDEGKAIGYAVDVLNRFGWNLRSAYKYSSSLRFVSAPDEQYGYRIHKCALQGFEHGEGNCLAWSGSFCAMAKVLGYDCRLIWGSLRWKGEDHVHGWTEIWEADGIHVYDPRKNEGEDFAGFDVRYGQKGSYRYNEDSKTYLKW